MKRLLLAAILLITANAQADLSTAFLVSRIEIEDVIKQIDVSENNLDSSIEALKKALAKLESYKEEAFADAFASIAADRPLNGLALTRIHSYLKIHLLTLERGLALADFASEKESSNVDEKAVAVMSLSMLNHADVYLENDRIRELLDKKDEAYDVKKKALRKAYERLTSKSIQKYVQKSIEAGINDDLAQAFHNHNKSWKKVRKAFNGDFWKRLKTFVVHHISGFIGNRAGSVKFRKGTMWEDRGLNSFLHKMLQPMDIITERTPFILTDKLIPGHFGHNALWLGTEAQLRALGIWDADYMKPFQAWIKEGYYIMETDRSGTHLKQLDKWMNVDEVAVIRRRDRPTSFDDINQFYAVLMAQHGKTYDFNFDVETTDKLVCSELLYQTYGDVIWPTERYLGRYTISPDNVAEIIAQKDSPFELIYSLERPEEGNEIEKGKIQLASNLGYTFNGIDDDGQFILEKETLTCMDRVDAEGDKVKTCLKTWVRPVFGGQSLRRFGSN